MDHSNDGEWLATTAEFATALGYFHGAFATLDLTTDFAIYKFLKVTPNEAHLITSGMMFGRKARLLSDLIRRSDHPNKAALSRTFSAVRGNKREIIAHGYLWSNQKVIKFIERNISGEFKAKEHSFTLKQFQDFVVDFIDKSTAFYDELGTSKEEVNDFANAVFSAAIPIRHLGGRHIKNDHSLPTTHNTHY